MLPLGLAQGWDRDVLHVRSDDGRHLALFPSVPNSSDDPKVESLDAGDFIELENANHN